MSRIWRYVLAADNGMAPCLQDGLLSLSCCKPLIRRSAQPGDWVIGYLPKGLKRGLGPHVAWAGKVAGVMSLGDYQIRYPHRYDAIYRRTGHSWEGHELLAPLRDDYHEDERSRVRDRSGRNALLFEPYWYWGEDAVTAPEIVAEMAHYYVGQSAKGSTPERVQALESWLRATDSPGGHGSPRDPRRTRPLLSSADA
jgi:hypothetical protein